MSNTKVNSGRKKGASSPTRGGLSCYIGNDVILPVFPVQELWQEVWERYQLKLTSYILAYKALIWGMPLFCYHTCCRQQIKLYAGALAITDSL
jgi:hypothetical protein